MCFQLEKEGSLSAEELARSASVSITLATERYIYKSMFSVCVCVCVCVCVYHWISSLSRLLITEKAGKACRDDSVEGLRFYPNRFLTEVS